MIQRCYVRKIQYIVVHTSELVEKAAELREMGTSEDECKRKLICTALTEAE